MTNYFCGCCGSMQVTRLAPHEKYDHIRCEDCGFEHFRKSDPEIAAGLYENDADYMDDLAVATNCADLLLWHHQNAIRYIQTNLKPGKTSVLDVGCFNGFFVKKMLSMGYDAHGIDFNKKAVAYGQEELGLGFRISSDSVEQCIAKGSSFDVITLFDVLEHLPDAKYFLANLLKLLKDDGVIIISTPNNNMCWRPPLDYPPHHVSRFTTKSLVACLSELGMKSLQTAEQMSIYELTRHYLGTFFRAKDKSSLRGGEFKYKLITTFLRRILNRVRNAAHILLIPFDKVLYLLGVRYISQIVIAGKQLP
jgi:2-polyprenyl-3-methyl-5-hydroxy-6-metoxy-1,4-benzoquinol methylase/DNA-directed RNA polymerase subunit RPC12/RpoP